jgi:PIN domain nuclease of toxin-antitoxin system
LKRTVLDASAVISFFEDRTGAEEVEKLVAEGVAGKIELFMSVVNWGEVYYSAWRARGQIAARQIAAEISQLPIQVVNADFELTKSAAELHAKYNLPYADCFAAALSKIGKARLLTADQDFAKIKSEIEIQFL